MARHGEGACLKKGINLNALSGDPGLIRTLDDFARCFESVRAYGFAGAQVTFSRDGYLTLSTSEADAKRVAALAESSDLTISSLDFGMVPFTHADPAVREQGIRETVRALGLASAMGVGGLMIAPGYVGIPWDPGVAVVPYDMAYERAFDALCSVAPAAEGLGVKVLIENVWNRFLLSPLELKIMLDEIDNPSVGVLLDVGNVVASGHPEHWIRILGARVREVHLKDFRRGVGTLDGFVGLLEGDVDWPALMGALRSISYSGFLTAEVVPEAYEGRWAVEKTSRALDRILGFPWKESQLGEEARKGRSSRGMDESEEGWAAP